jgi:hypothetical protein
MTFKALLASTLLASGALAVNAAPATAGECLDAAIADCDKRFSPQAWHPMVAVLRGYCYLLLSSACLADAT